MEKKQYKKNILYITYDGIFEALGKSQVLEYLYINSEYYSFFLVSFEKKEHYSNQEKIQELKKKLSSHNIEWLFYKYENKKNIHRIIYNFIKITLKIIQLCISKKIQLIHIRSYFPGFLILPIIYFSKIKLIFDMRGFLQQEKIDRLKWKKNDIKIKILNIIEKILVKKSSKIVTLTVESKNIIANKYKINKKNIVNIPTCVNTSNFVFKKNNKGELFNLCFLGSTNSAYDFDKIINIYKNINKNYDNCRLDFILNDKNDFIKNLLIKHRVNTENIKIKYLDFNKIPDILYKYHFGLCVLKKNNSIKGSFPTKISEYLACGVPIICNDFNHDISQLVTKNKLGIIINDVDFDFNLLKRLQNYHDKNNNIHCRNYAENFLSTKYGSLEYQKLYESIL